ncbi:MAG: radical SAM protein [Candidatus Bathyarchaeota archaeon]|nr:radical SAM protein [Candidatus Bathyarchaeota archaeon]
MSLPMFNIVRASLCTCLPKYNINPYLGRCAHNCIYCYAVKFPSFTGPVIPRLRLKEEISRMVKKARMRLPVMLSDSTDPYQPLERNYEITRRCIEVLANNCFPILIVTKSDLVIRDINVLKKTPTVVSMTITTTRSDVASIIEPNAPEPNARFHALKRVVDENIPAVVRIDPIIPSVNSDINDLERIVSKSSEIGVKQVTASTMKMTKNLLSAIRRENPGLSRRLIDLYRDGEWIGGYKYLNIDLRRSILSRLKSIVEDYGLMFATCREGFPDLNTTICDGTAYCRKTLDDLFMAEK